MPATVLNDPLAVRFVFPDGSTLTASFAGLPNPVLAHDLAVGLAANAHPHGGIGARKTAVTYASCLRQMVIKLSSAGFTGGANDLTRAMLMRLWLAGTRERERNLRFMLKGFDAEVGTLNPGVRDYLAGSHIQPRPRSRPYQAYTDGEWARLEIALKTYLAEQRALHKEAQAAAADGIDPRLRPARFEDVCWLLVSQGPMRFYTDYIKLLCAHRGGLNRERPMFSRAVAALFPRRDVQVAYATLFGMYSGIVPDGIDDLTVGDIDWAGDTSVLLSYVKGRTSQESSALPRQAVQLLQKWLEHSELMRSFAPKELRDQLWFSYNDRGFLGLPPNRRTQHRLVVNLGAVDDSGEPLVIHRSRIRVTYIERLARRGWTGRVTIDPNHAARTEGDHYATPTSPVELDAVQSIIEDGQVDLLRKALPAVVLSSDQTAELVKSLPDEVRRLGLDATALQELVGGERDVFTAACADQLAGMHGPAGQPCPARPWVCLLCPLAVFLPRHAPNLLRLNGYFSRQFRQMPADHFMRVFGPYAERLANEILPKFSDTVKSQASVEVADNDGGVPLRPEETTA
ncbi:hypothetical protein [Nocardia anaemiae]|uniref:hypothetical protein n=1 Tax=Nocardia anaemiae TaxID=263910 RepID=UPI0007C78058|nr:hypothetical protein [Nocardia anaemiae]